MRGVVCIWVKSFNTRNKEGNLLGGKGRRCGSTRSMPGFQGKRHQVSLGKEHNVEEGLPLEMEQEKEK